MPRKMGTGEWLRLAQENIKAVLFLLGVVITGTSIALSVAAGWADKRMDRKIAPMQDILVWQLDQSGKLEEYRRYKAHKDSTDAAVVGRVSSAEAFPYPIWRSK